MTDEAKSRSLQGWVDRGIPVLQAVKHDPVLQDDYEEIEMAIRNGDLGYDDETDKVE